MSPLREVGPSGWLRPHSHERPPDPDAPGKGLVLGVLALQGAFAEHAVAFARLGSEVREVRRPEHLQGIDGLAIPGGESTTMSKLLVSSGLFGELGARLSAGFPVFGTCAGLILLASAILDGRPDQEGFAAIDVAVRRNGYGRQRDSFEADVEMPVLESGEPVRAVFIRAPRIESAGPTVQILGSVGGVPVVVRQGHVLAASFHPEMTAELRIHRYFVESLIRGN